MICYLCSENKGTDQLCGYAQLICTFVFVYSESRFSHDAALIFVHLQGQVSIPGTIGAFVVERPADVEEGFSQSAPLVFHYGHTSPAKNLTLYNMLVSRTADVVNMKCDESKKGKITSTQFSESTYT